jgi:hypothetical protein
VTQRIAVIGDAHGNAPALSAAIEATTDADVLILLGDLLSYGPDVEAILTLVESVLSSRDGVLIRGNHDQHYADVERTAGSRRSPRVDIREHAVCRCAGGRAAPASVAVAGRACRRLDDVRSCQPVRPGRLDHTELGGTYCGGA